MKCGLLGGKLGHSYSPQIHSHLGDYSYELFEKNPEDVGDFLKNGDFHGINVTIPYKKDVIPYCQQLSPMAQRMGAVNTIIRQTDGTLIGHNTDYFGFSTMLKASSLTVNGKKVLVLGSGGASNTAVAVLKDAGADVVIISRSGENNYSNLQLHEDAYAIVNTTPVGMYPNNGISPVDLSNFPKLKGVLDMIYNPERTKLLQDAESLGLIAMNGLLMLVAQAKESAEWFTGKTLSDDLIYKILGILRREMENIILIGMPGSGKSTVGKLIAELTGKQFADADVYLANKANRAIPEIFATDGEAYFRALESETLSYLGKQAGMVIATGGGCVTREENYAHLHQNGTIFYLQRDLEKLPIDGRPLSQKTKAEDMFRVRYPMYCRFADHVIDNNLTPEAAAKMAESIWEEKT